MAGGYEQQSGGGGDYQCLPHDVQWNFNTSAPASSTSYMYAQLFGTEYEMNQRTFRPSIYQSDAPCCMCQTQRSMTVMIPGRTSCFPGWTLEYAGYLGANWIGTGAATTNFVCLDGHPEVLDRSASNDNQAVIHNVVSKCGSLPCPPYSDGRELACVVCSM